MPRAVAGIGFAFVRVRVAVRRDVGRLIARGNTSDVYEWTGGAIVKVLKPELPSDWARTEARAVEEAKETGLPVPAIYGIVTVEGRQGIVMERISGRTLGGPMSTQSDHLEECSATLVHLQQMLNRTRGLEAFPSLKDRLRLNIHHAGVLSTEHRRRLLELLDDLPNTRLMCHFDLHPGNVIVGSDGPVIIDWFDAAPGDPAADVVRTAMLLRYGAADTHVQPEIMARVHRSYVTHLTRCQWVDLDALLAWEPVVMGARLAEPIPDELLRVTHHGLIRVLNGDSPLLASLRECRIAA